MKKQIMLTISMFYGIIIRMFYTPKEHNPPHFKAYFQNFKAIIDINTCSPIDRVAPKRQLRMVEALPEIHKDELLADWNFCQSGEKPYSIEPLK